MASNEANSEMLTMLTNLTERFEARFDSLAREVAGNKGKAGSLERERGRGGVLKWARSGRRQECQT